MTYLLNTCIASHQSVSSIRPKIIHVLFTDMAEKPSQEPVHYSFSVNTCLLMHNGRGLLVFKTLIL